MLEKSSPAKNQRQYEALRDKDMWEERRKPSQTDGRDSK
jgi:hypothetical protein